MSYRRRKGSDTWHWVRTCSNWPKRGYGVIRFKPTYGELCNECQSKSRRKSGRR
jgi:hypothetical protein